MRASRLPLLLAAVLGVLVSACGSVGVPPALTVGDVEVSRQELEDEFAALEDNPTFLQALGVEAIRNSVAGYDREFVNTVVRNRVIFLQVQQELEANNLEVTDEDRELIRQSFRDPFTGADFLAGFEDQEYADRVLDDFTGYTVLQTFFGDDATYNAFFEAKAADVRLDPRYGTWDAQFRGVTPPAGPLPEPFDQAEVPVDDQFTG